MTEGSPEKGQAGSECWHPASGTRLLPPFLYPVFLPQMCELLLKIHLHVKLMWMQPYWRRFTRDLFYRSPLRVRISRRVRYGLEPSWIISLWFGTLSLTNVWMYRRKRLRVWTEDLFAWLRPWSRRINVKWHWKPGPDLPGPSGSRGALPFAFNVAISCSAAVFMWWSTQL